MNELRKVRLKSFLLAGVVIWGRRAGQLPSAIKTTEGGELVLMQVNWNNTAGYKCQLLGSVT